MNKQICAATMALLAPQSVSAMESLPTESIPLNRNIGEICANICNVLEKVITNEYPKEDVPQIMANVSKATQEVAMRKGEVDDMLCAVYNFVEAAAMTRYEERLKKETGEKK